MPRQVTPGAFQVGKDLAVTPGHVVFRNRLIELIQYEPQTAKVHEIPLLMSPPWINKYYIMDLAPQKSLVEWAVQHGHTVFMISYRNPDSSLADVTMSDYLQEGPVAAMEVVREITGQDKVNVAGLCLGGALSAAMTAWLEAKGDQHVNSLTLMNTLLDYSGPGQLGVFTDEKTVNRLERNMRKDGYLPATSMKTTFDLLRSTDLVWNYVVNDWMLGEDPKPFDMLTWNSDSTRMPAAMQTEYLRTLYLENRFAEGKLELAGSGSTWPTSGPTATSSPRSPTTSRLGSRSTPGRRRSGHRAVRPVELRAHRRRGEPAVAEVAALVRRERRPPGPRRGLA